MSAELLVGVAGVVVSFLFESIPGLHDWYNSLQNNYQRLVMFGVLFVVAGAIFGLNCAQWFGEVLPKVECSAAGLEGLFILVLTAVISNQSTFALLPRKDNAG
mgnify:CR=1 FL=1